MSPRAAPFRGEYQHVDRTVEDMAAPDAAEAMCCIGASFTDGERCTCWRAITHPPQEPLQEGPMNVCRRACDDCAYRNGSPERTAEGGEVPTYGPNQPFMCHKGMPITTVLVHPPTGEARRPSSDDYQPVTIGGHAWLADGRPASFCAGWAAVNRIRSTERAVS